MALPSITAVFRDFTAGQITERAARRDDLELQRAGLKEALNARPLASGAMAQRFGRAAYNLDTGRTEIVRITDLQRYEFLFADGALRVRDAAGAVVGEFGGLPWTLATIADIRLAQAEREVIVCYRNTRPYVFRLGATTTIDSALGEVFGDMLDALPFPSVAATAVGSWPNAVNGIDVPLPSGIEAGDGLIVLMRASSAPSTPAGWSSLASRSSSGVTTIFSRIADGSEGATVAISFGISSSRAASIAHRITGITKESVTRLAAAFAGSNTLDPPSLTPSWGSANNLWLALASTRRTDNAFTAAPASYGDLIEQESNPSNSSTAMMRVASATRQVAGSPENPGVFSTSGTTDNPHAATVAARPIADEEELAKAFDGETSKTAAACITKSAATSAMIGLDFSAAPQKIASVTVWGSNDEGFVGGADPDVTLTIRGKNGSPPSSASDGTDIGTDTFTDTENESAGRSLSSTDSSTDYDYVWVEITHDGSANPIHVAQVRFTGPAPAGAEESWLLSPFRFAETSDGAKKQPYIRYARPGITLLPTVATSGLAGETVTLTASDPIFAAAHVGVSFRWHGREIVITAVASAVSATGLVIETLPPLQRVVFGNQAIRDAFKLGEVVIGETSGAEGLIVALNSTVNMDVIVYKGGDFADSERIVSPTGSGIVSSTSEQTRVASPVWDEALMSDYRGWPASVSHDRSRLMLCDFPQAPAAVAWSAIGNPTDFAIGAEADDGFLEYAPGQGRVRHIIGGADQYVLTDLGAMYIPISEANPLVPGGVAFRPIAAIGAGSVRPVQMHEGIVYATLSGRSLVAIIPTGQTSFPYQVAAISEFHADIFTGVRALAAMAGSGESAEQYLWVAQDDGSAIVGRLDRSSQWAGFVPVTGAGAIRWIAALGSDVRFNVDYDTGGSWLMERLDEAQFIDGAVPLNLAAPAMRPEPEDLSLGRLWFWAGLEVDLMDGETWLGAREVDEDGFIVEEDGDDFSASTVMAGFGFTFRLRPFLPNVGEGEERGQRVRRRRVKRAAVHVQDATAFAFMGRTFGGAAAISGTFRSPGQGRSFAPEVLLEKTMPGPIVVTEIDAEVTL